MQNIFCKQSSLINKFSKLCLTSRSKNIIISPLNVGLKHEAKDLLSKLNIPEKPRKPVTAFLLYLTEKRPIIKTNSPNLKNIDIVKKASEEWNRLTPDIKQTYIVQAQQNKEDYKQKIIEFNNSLTPEQQTVLKEIESELREDAKKRKLKHEMKQHNKPKKPASPYNLFLVDFAKQQGEPIRNIMDVAKSRWVELSEQEKGKYHTLYEEKAKKYEEEITLWETKMISEGREKLVRGKTLKSFINFNEKKAQFKKSA